jgi:hypothetical protein
MFPPLQFFHAYLHYISYVIICESSKGYFLLQRFLVITCDGVKIDLLLNIDVVRDRLSTKVNFSWRVSGIRSCKNTFDVNKIYDGFECAVFFVIIISL